MALFGNILGGGNAPRQSGMSTINMALLGVLAYRTLKGKGRLAEMLGRGNPATPAPGTATSAPANEGGLGGLLGGLGGLGALGGLFGGEGAAGSAISDGLRHLMERFQQNGHGDKLQSWISPGPNKPISPDELEEALGEERVQWLMQETGLPKDQLLAGLSQKLPEAVDKLTPEGRLPEPHETVQRIKSQQLH
jgi:uncharacterized protein YidB (DUF937 family)